MSSESGMPMKIDADIDAAVKMLGETQPPAEMVSRVHQSLTIAATVQPTSLSRRILIPTAGVAMVTVALVTILTQIYRTPKNQESAARMVRLVANTPMTQTTIASPSAAAETERSDEGKRLVRYYVKPRSRPSRDVRRAVNLLSYPLTRQEKLLLQFAHHAKPADLQALNPEYQAKVEAQQDAEFAAYLKSGGNSDAQSATETKQLTQE